MVGTDCNGRKNKEAAVIVCGGDGRKNKDAAVIVCGGDSLKGLEEQKEYTCSRVCLSYLHSVHHSGS